MNYLKSLLLLLSFVTNNNCFAQTKTSENFGEFHMGIAYGAETFLALPKVEYNYFIKKNKVNYSVGASGSIWAIFTAFGSIGIKAGIQYKLGTLENGVTVLGLSSGTNGGSSSTSSTETRYTMTQKIGLKYKAIWLKVGPSVVLYRTYNLYNYTPPINIDLIFRILNNDGPNNPYRRLRMSTILNNL
jgi:hypothetical protein